MSVAVGESTTVLVVGKQPKEIAYLTKHLTLIRQKADEIKT
jgi:hypothetical protein